ncbi:hypothetical protein GXP67_01090 [Rhodocytophaga rosea]|uniref:Uncharacterized protein n=1 Tax=Rhodocytophaga rosea TaxID=2704465 RepID=A0A6C0GBV3_9BACT|nr:hypothetical protein [Rhodocytophaga rosea]QHT65368.1 hypothetical protein GXP67_01090 [Rhodocytophaga rosea]
MKGDIKQQPINKQATKDKFQPVPLLTLDFLIKEALQGDTKLSITQFRELCNIPKVTWYRRMQEPQNFSVEEIKAMADVLVRLAHLSNKPATVTPAQVLEAILNQIKLKEEDNQKG